MKLKKFGLILAAIGCVASSSFAAELIAYAKTEGTNRVTAFDSNGRSVCSIAAGPAIVKLVGFTSTTFTFGQCGGSDCSNESNWYYRVFNNSCHEINYWWGH